MEPTKKSKGIDDLLNAMSGGNRTESIESNKCVWCGGDATEFADEASRREYAITGICQKCQDDAWGKM